MLCLFGHHGTELQKHRNTAAGLPGWPPAAQPAGPDRQTGPIRRGAIEDPPTDRDPASSTQRPRRVTTSPYFRGRRVPSLKGVASPPLLPWPLAESAGRAKADRQGKALPRRPGGPRPAARTRPERVARERERARVKPNTKRPEDRQLLPPRPRLRPTHRA